MNQKAIYKIGVCALLLGCLTACHQTPKELQFATIERDESAALTDDSGSPKCSIEIDLPYVTNEDSIAQRINETVVLKAFHYEHLAPEVAVDSFISNYKRTYQRDLRPYYEEEKNSNKTALAWYNYFFTLEGEAESGVEGVLNYKLEIETYEGGAHGTKDRIFLNFQLTDGHLMSLDELFNPGYEADLSAILLDKLMKKIDVKDFAQLQEEGFLIWTDMYPSKNFLLKDDKIVFLYNPYEIAPYSAGAIELKVKYDELTDLLKND